MTPSKYCRQCDAFYPEGERCLCAKIPPPPISRHEEILRKSIALLEASLIIRRFYTGTVKPTKPAPLPGETFKRKFGQPKGTNDTSTNLPPV